MTRLTEYNKKLKTLSTVERDALRQRFRELMALQGIETYRGLRKITGLSQSAISQIVCGEFMPHPKTVARLSYALGIEPQQFYATLGLEEHPRIGEAEKYSLEVKRAPPLIPLPPEQQARDLDKYYLSLKDKTLNNLYEKGDFVTKARIIGGLELLVRLHRK